MDEHFLKQLLLQVQNTEKEPHPITINLMSALPGFQNLHPNQTLKNFIGVRRLMTALKREQDGLISGMKKESLSPVSSFRRVFTFQNTPLHSITPPLSSKQTFSVQVTIGNVVTLPTVMTSVDNPIDFNFGFDGYDLDFSFFLRRTDVEMQGFPRGTCNRRDLFKVNQNAIYVTFFTRKPGEVTYTRQISPMPYKTKTVLKTLDDGYNLFKKWMMEFWFME